jgi:amidase
MELAFLSALEQARLVRSGELSSTELVEHHLERIDRLDPTLNSFVTVCGDEALEAAALVDRRRQATHRSAEFRSRSRTWRRPPASARRIRRAHSPITSRTSTAPSSGGSARPGSSSWQDEHPEFGTVAFTESELNGATRNPWNTALTPGGSSGGAAAALAAGLVPAAHATDGVAPSGSPHPVAACSGSSHRAGAFSSAPFGSFEGFSTAGPLTRTVEDAAHILDVLAGYEPEIRGGRRRPSGRSRETVAGAPPRLRIAVTSTPPIDVVVDSECIAALTAAAAWSPIWVTT